MIKEDAKHLSEVLKAFSEGKTIQYKEKTSEEWQDLYFQSWTNVYSSCYDYRVKPEPKYRPYANAEEFLKAQKEHVMTVKDDYCYYNVASFNNEAIYLAIGKSYNYAQIVDMFVWADDGTPCGILE